LFSGTSVTFPFQHQLAQSIAVPSGGLKNVVVISLEFAPEAVERVKKEISKRGPLS